MKNFGFKKLYICLMIILLICTSCSSSKRAENGVKSTSKTVNEVLAEKTDNNVSTNNGSSHGGNVVDPNDKSNIQIKKPQGGLINNGSNLKRSNTNTQGLTATDIDVDLTRLSSTMVYSEVSNMMNSPEAYVGKLVRMHGKLAVYKYPERNYYTCIINDALGCCASGMEFVWKGNHTYPDDYPNEGDGIIVTGIFDIYYEGDNKYCQLKDASLVKTRT